MACQCAFCAYLFGTSKDARDIPARVVPETQLRLALVAVIDVKSV